MLKQFAQEILDLTALNEVHHSVLGQVMLMMLLIVLAALVPLILPLLLTLQSSMLMENLHFPLIVVKQKLVVQTQAVYVGQVGTRLS